MNKKLCLKVLVANIIFSSICVAKECRFLVYREVCPGKDAKEILRPYDNQKTAVESKDVNAQKDCIAAAETAAQIVRPGLFKSKKVDSIFFDGNEIKQTFADSKECVGK